MEDTVKEMKEEAVKYQNTIELLKIEMSSTENRAIGSIEDLSKLFRVSCRKGGRTENRSPVVTNYTTNCGGRQREHG